MQIKKQSKVVLYIIHELGHALGMGHLNRSDNVINWFMNETVVLDDFNRNSYDMAYSNY